MPFFAQIRVSLSIITAFLCISALNDARAAGAAFDPAVKGVFGDWALRCESNAQAAGEQCVLVQNVSAEDRPNLQMVVIVLRNPSGGYILRVVVPLGVILPSGLGLKIDRADIGRTGFMRCLANGCLAEVVMDEALVNRFSTGDTALFVVFPAPDDGVGIPIKLTGFANGLVKLQ
ncbi:MAG: invasion associated locus B family protein [Alphaproteobacteria bacterium]|nr:invasion associated locus B family protein [Beijerinckiaceae bacterium]NBQ38453.1 invasion associated locus B family protein [Alphaproteobacteria bacterium]